jgi:4-alpha-glucanotransferase
LQTFAQFIDQGMLPNVFPGHGETPEYNTVDAALWYIEAWRAYVDVTDDWSEFRKIFPVLEDIIRWYSEGTRYGIALDKQDGLLKAGEPGIQLTWMDAKVGDWVVTPRTGKAVEINALWYNALAIMANFARHTQVSAKAYEEQAAATKIGFQRFPYSPLDEATQQAVVKLCGKALLTSYGLRSLSADQPHYTPRYGGGVRERDSAYHQGTVWAWLLGHYALAEYKVSQDVNLSMHRLEPIRDHLFDAGLGTVSEIFDAEPPHAPNGTPAQAW